MTSIQSDASNILVPSKNLQPSKHATSISEPLQNAVSRAQGAASELLAQAQVSGSDFLENVYETAAFQKIADVVTSSEAPLHVALAVAEFVKNSALYSLATVPVTNVAALPLVLLGMNPLVGASLVGLGGGAYLGLGYTSQFSEAGQMRNSIINFFESKKLPTAESIADAS